MKTLGIDLSANEQKTGVCLIDWPAGTVEFPRRGAKDESLVRRMAEVHMTVIGIPLGWPDAFVDAVVAHRAGAGWPAIDTAPPLDRLPLRFRLTDVVIMSNGAQPLSVSTDRLGVSSMRGARVQHLAREAGIAIDRSGISGRVAEAHPPESLRQWGLPSAGYKGGGAKAAALCAQLAAELASKCGPMAASAAASLEGCDDDGLDAFICAVMARAVILGKTTRPDPEQMVVAQHEGWIHVPTASMEDIVMATP